jgi:hypothetical protein
MKFIYLVEEKNSIKRIELTGDEVAIAIDAYLVAHGVRVFGPRTIKVNNELCQHGVVLVDPSGCVRMDHITKHL